VALRSALLGKLRDGEVRELRGLSWAEPSAREARRVLAACAPRGSVLVLLKDRDPVLWRSFRNFPQVGVRVAAEANAYDLLAHKWLLAQEGALELIAGRCGAE
jgi:ribosomal protein L4